MAKAKSEKTCKLYKKDGTVTDILPKNGKKFKLEELYELLNIRMVEHVQLRKSGLPTLSLLCDEEGKMVDNWMVNLNYTATLEWFMYYGDTDGIIGDVIICTPSYF